MIPGDIVEVRVDKVIMLDMVSVHPEFMNNPPKRPFDVSKVAVIFDHYVPPPTIEIATNVEKIRKLVKTWGVKQFFDYGRGGISHAFAAESGWLLPGRIVINSDSHTIAAGGYNALEKGVGTPELIQVICTGKTWFIVGETNKIMLHGSLKPSIEAKDVFLEMAQKIGDIPNQNVEFGGEGIKTLTIDDRAVISTMCAELGAEFAIFPFDGLLEEYLRDKAESVYKPVYADPDARYKEKYDIELDKIEPLVALPDKVAKNVKSVREVEGTPIDLAVVGSCANGRLNDIAIVAKILDGKRVHPDVKLIVTPATQRIYLEAEKRGYISKIIQAGGLVTNSTCGACFGGHMGVAGTGQTVITSTTRNFKGRMGSPEAKIYIGSSATVAASALYGVITDPRKVLGYE